jgi:hypothetical protein
VGAGVVEVLALEEDAGAAGVLGKPAGVVQPRRAADVVGEELGELGLERGVAAGVAVGGVELVEGGHERLGDEPAAVRAEPAADVGDLGVMSDE